MSRMHRKAVERKRSIIFNNDGNDAWLAKQANPKGLLEVRAIPSTTDTQVDTVFYCTTLGFGSCMHDTDVAEIFTKDVEGKRNITKALINQGTNPLTLMVDHCRKNNVEIFASIRMNDIHDGAGWPVFFTEYKKKHLDFLFGSEQNKPPCGYWSGVDYGRSNVRETMLQFLSELCNRYDIDGIELDFYRHYPFFKRHAWGEPALPEELDQMTEMMRRIREMTRACEEQRGKPLLVAARILESVELSRDNGLDILRWLKDGLIDLLVPGEVMLAPWEELIDLGHRYEVPVYPCLLRTRVYDDAERKGIESFRALALASLKKGADGVYLFNLFPEEGYAAVFQEVGNLTQLKQADKLYCLDAVGIKKSSEYTPSLEKYMRRLIVSPRNPLTIRSDATCRIPIYVGDAVHETSKKPQVLFRVHLDGVESSSEVGAVLHGNVLPESEYTDGEIRWKVRPEWLGSGYNLFEVKWSGVGEAKIQDVKLQLRY